ncbi:hypothetical protein C427_1748 [Paraglaciecola psychrophila 170]|uniref:Uncharacterized protein n=1 Tax=Paraglaciecola psychrophila 170 TaxID=1129794 RepID=K7APK4_9ALTE|nr:hypothetical protein C427_1748 [Paraglaciecola psychrophila 170]GAC37265.1 hypothetical protein GPSY_1636 [Paraglaciecola psychrophila 170]
MLQPINSIIATTAKLHRSFRKILIMCLPLVLSERALHRFLT